MAPAQPELKKYLDKRLFVQLNGSRKVIGILRGYDVSSIRAIIQTKLTETGLPEHCPRRSGGGEGWRREGENWHGCYPW
ncbi:hypothetical protein BFJ68_g6763 [Fusarium oxysporum]|uniref:Sm domain-containing protein n=1 Tax=Fusarium oxysporum TaxID=5507 RepID=A0A420RAC3_FUSOX|nr:hypothetical protein BFJ68_g6763 [Fusarium oxysporum]